MIGDLTGLLAVAAPFLMIVGIVWVKSKTKLEEQRIAAGTDRADDTRSSRQDSRIEMLEDRVQVLERIITDKGYDVASKIEALRHDHRIDEDLADLKRAREGEQNVR